MGAIIITPSYREGGLRRREASQNWCMIEALSYHLTQAGSRAHAFNQPRAGSVGSRMACFTHKGYENCSHLEIGLFVSQVQGVTESGPAFTYAGLTGVKVIFIYNR